LLFSRSVFACLLLGAAVPLWCQPTVLTIAEAQAEAIQNNPGLMAEKLGLPVADTALVTAGLKPNPVVSVSSDHLDLLGTGFSAANGAGPSETALRVDVPLERGNKRELRLDNAGYARKIAEARYADSVRRLRQDVTLACIDLLAAKAKLALANDNLQALDKVVQFNQTRLKGGAIAPVELTRARVAMLQYRGSVRTAELALLTARTHLETLLGRRPGGTIDITGDLKVPLPASGPNLQQLQTEAQTARPDITAVRVDQARSQSDLRLQIANGKIDYLVGMEVRRQQGVNGTGNSLGFFFSAPLPVYNRNQGEIARASREQEQLRQSLEAVQAQVTSDVAGAFEEYESARTLAAEIERDLLEPTKQARDTTAYVYQAGASTLVDVLDAQRAFNDTMSAYYDALADYRRASAKLSAAVGQEVIP
jgi:cobalt-zinc-cadmium efflux system outer membrane protein